MYLCSSVFLFVSYVLSLKRVPLRYNALTSSSRSYKNGIKYSFLQSSVDMNWDPKSAPKLDFNEDYYSILEVDPTIKSTDLKKQYYKLVFKYHPDNKRSDDEKALCNKQMMVINNAYKILKDKTLRQKYDIQRRSGFYGATSKVKQSAINDQDVNSDQSTTNKKTTTSTSSTTSNSNAYNQDSSKSSTTTDESFESFFNDILKKQQKTTSSTYGYTSSKNKYNNGNTDDSYYQVESLGDILNDFWSDITSDGGKHVFQGFVEFLEDQVPPEIRNSVQGTAAAATAYSSSSSSSSSSNRDGVHVDINVRPEDLLAEINMFQTTIKSLEKHMKDIEIERSTAMNTLNTQATTTSSNKDVSYLETRLRLIETIKGLDARIYEVKKQIKKLTEQVIKKQNVYLRMTSTTTGSTTSGSGSDDMKDTKQSSTDKTNNTTTNNNSSYENMTNRSSPYSSSYSSSSSTTSTTVSKKPSKDELVEKELEKLKQLMKNK